MRTTHYLGCLLLGVLVTLGCNSTKMGKSPTASRGTTSSNELQDPFTLSSRDGTLPRDPVNGVLAGYVMDRWRNPLSEVTIEIVDLNDQPSGGKKARITTTTDRQGQYKFEGLNPSHQYQLVARTRDGNRQLVGLVLGSPPNPRLPIFVTEDFSGAADPRSAAKDLDSKTSQGTERIGAPVAPAATLSPPLKNPQEEEYTPTPTNSLPGAPFPDAGQDRSRTTQDGFTRNPIVTIPGPTTPSPAVIPPPPRTSQPGPLPGEAPGPPTGGFGPEARLGVPEGPSPDLPAMPVTTPSCLLIGRKLTNFSLYDLEGRPWIYTRDRDRNARVVLLDFWYTTCGPCLQSLPHIRALQRDFGPAGLQVIGITHEQGSLNDVAGRVRGARGRYNLNYVTLLSGVNSEPCPVVSQFQITHFPTMVLLDDTGTIIWRKVGALDPQSQAELDFILRKKLGLRMP